MFGCCSPDPYRMMRSRRSWTGRLGALAVLSTLAASALPATGAVAADTATPPPLMVTPAGSGIQDGLSWASAAPISTLSKLVQLRPDGGEILIRSDAGPYELTGPIALAHGGSVGHPVVIRGVDGAGRPAAPLLAGTRTSPYSPTGAFGSDVFRLLKGADDLTFRDLAFRDHGNGVFRVGGDISNLTIEDVTATNVGRFVENYVSGGATTASINGLTVRRVDVAGFSRSVARLQYQTRNVLLEDVKGDSERQEGQDVAMGVHLEGWT